MPDLRSRFPCAGYWELDSADFGIPQHRRRIFLWAGPVEPKRPRETHGPGRLPYATIRAALGIRVFATATAHGPGEVAAERAVQELTDRPVLTVPASKMSPTAGGSMWGGVWADDRPSPTIATTDGVGLASASGRDLMETLIGRRSLSHRECAKLQDFPEDYPFCGISERVYVQVGNAVPPTMAELVGRAILEAT